MKTAIIIISLLVVALIAGCAQASKCSASKPELCNTKASCEAVAKWCDDNNDGNFTCQSNDCSEISVGNLSDIDKIGDIGDLENFDSDLKDMGLGDLGI